MAVPRTPMTRQGYERLREELERLRRVERPSITKAIAEARAHGDLSENAEYHAAREKQSFTEARINDLEGKLGNAEVIEPPTSGDRVTFGSTVRWRARVSALAVVTAIGRASVGAVFGACPRLGLAPATRKMASRTTARERVNPMSIPDYPVRSPMLR